MNLSTAIDLLGLGVSIVAMALAATRKQAGSRGLRYLCLVFLETGAYFLSESLRALWGPSFWSLLLNFAVSFLSMPALYLFVKENSGTPEPRPLRHFMPALALLPIGGALAAKIAAQGFRGGLDLAAFILLVPLAQATQTYHYGRAALRAASDSAWARRIILAAISGFSAFLACSILSSAFSVAAELLGLSSIRGLDTAALLSAFLLVWTLGLCLAWGATERQARARYGGKALPSGRSEDLLSALKELLEREEDLGSQDVEPRALAERLGIGYHALSQAVNQGLGMSVGEYVNEFRVERAKRALLERPEAGVLEIGLEAGFASKSTFNSVFKRSTGLTPSLFRAEGLRADLRAKKKPGSSAEPG